MTLGEAIENELKTSDAYFEQADKLNDMRATTTDQASREQYKEMAVDLIEKGANHRILAAWLKQYKKLKEAYRWAIELLEQEPKMGHWIHFATSDDCSECGWSTGKYISPSKYCPNCGAMMFEPQESEDNNADSN